MVIKVEQTKSNLKNKFEIKINNEVKYLAGTPWMNLQIPFDIDRVRSCVLTDTNENLCLETNYNIGENIVNDIIPLKWVFTGEQKSLIFKLLDNKNNICGKFYELTNGLLDTKQVIEYKNYDLKCYDVSKGKARHILVYNETGQIAEIIKPLIKSNNLDYYYIFLLDEYKELEMILSFYTVFFDYRYYSNAGETVISTNEMKFKYTYSENNKFYNKNWLLEHFNQEEINLVNNQLLKDRQNISNNFYNQAKYILIFLVLTLLLLFIIFMFV